MSISYIEVLCTSKVYQELYNVIKNYNLKPDNIQKVRNHDAYFITFNDIRWNEYYPEIKDFMHVLYDNAAKSNDYNCHFSFIHFGDEGKHDIREIFSHDYESPFDKHYVYVNSCKPILEDIDELL
jgi:hypothetical protein